MSATIATRHTAAALLRSPAGAPLRAGRSGARATSLALRSRRPALTAARRAPAAVPVRWQQQRASSPQTASSTDPASTTKQWSFDDLRARVPNSSATTEPGKRPLVLIDVREPHELEATGRIPGAHNVPISTFPDAVFLPPDEFVARFGVEKPSPGMEVVFYCKSGVRSRAAAQMVGPTWTAEGVTVGEFAGSWTEWAARGGESEK